MADVRGTVSGLGGALGGTFRYGGLFELASAGRRGLTHATSTPNEDEAGGPREVVASEDCGRRGESFGR